MGEAESEAVRELTRVLCDTQEHSMVRHEAAEALGAIVDTQGACRDIIAQHLNDGDAVVAESCLVALDMLHYWAPYKQGAPPQSSATRSAL